MAGRGDEGFKPISIFDLVIFNQTSLLQLPHFLTRESGHASDPSDHVLEPFAA